MVFASRAEQDGSADDLWTVPLSGGPPTRLTNQGGVNVPYGWAPDGRVLYWHSSPTEPGDLWAIVHEPRPAPARTPPAPAKAPARAPDVERAGGSWSASCARRRRSSSPAPRGSGCTPWSTSPPAHQAGPAPPAHRLGAGGPTGFSRFDYAPLLSWLANEGFLVVTPNYRGSTGHGVAFMEAVAGEGLGQNDLADVLAAAEYARAHPCADTAAGGGRRRAQLGRVPDPDGGHPGAGGLQLRRGRRGDQRLDGAAGPDGDPRLRPLAGRGLALRAGGPGARPLPGDARRPDHGPPAGLPRRGRPERPLRPDRALRGAGPPGGGGGGARHLPPGGARQRPARRTSGTCWRRRGPSSGATCSPGTSATTPPPASRPECPGDSILCEKRLRSRPPRPGAQRLSGWPPRASAGG